MTESEKAGKQCLQDAFIAVNKEYGDKIEGLPEQEFVYSKRYRRFIKKLIRNQKRSFWMLINTVGKRAAVFACAFLLVFAFSMSVSAIRVPAFKFIANVYEGFTEIFFKRGDIKEAPKTVETAYILGYIPEGYKLKEKSDSLSAIITVWENDSGNELIFMQTILSSQMMLDNDDTESEQFFVEEQQINKLSKNGVNIFFWNDNEYLFRLSCFDDVSDDDFIEMFSSLTETADN